MFSNIALWVIVIVCAGLALRLLYWGCLDPFGPSSRCREAEVIKTRDHNVIRLMTVDQNAAMPMARSILGDNNHRIANLVDLRRIHDDDYLRKQLPGNARILGEEIIDGGKTILWALDTSDDWNPACRVTRLNKIETPSSFEDCYIAALPCT